MAENTVQTYEAQAQAENGREDTREPERYVTPAVDIYEVENGLVVVADMPGLEKEDVDVATDKDILTIKGRARQAIEREWAYQEFQPTGYFREFRLGNKIDQGKINAEYSGGVLKVQLPFAEEVKPRKIDVKVA
jgi:HSP20 family molecular chaperone IbpA